MDIYKEYCEIRDIIREGILKVDGSHFVVSKAIVNIAMVDYLLRVFEIVGFKPPEDHEEFLERVSKDNYFVYRKHRSLFTVDSGINSITFDSVLYNISGKIRLVIVEERGTTGAAFEDDTVYVNLGDDKILSLISIYINSPKIQFLKNILDSKIDDLEHEFVHVTEILAKWDRDDSQMARDEEGKYYKSKVEREAQTLTLVRNFIRNVKMAAASDIDIFEDDVKEYIKYVIDGKDVREQLRGWLVEPSRFVRYAKELSKPEYRSILKKFYVEVMKSVEDLKKEGIVKSS